MDNYDNILDDMDIKQEDVYVRGKLIGKHTYIPAYYESRLLQYIQGELRGRLHYDIVETLNGKVEVLSGQNETIVVQFITTIHCKKHAVGIVLVEDEILTKDTRVIMDYLVDRFIHSFTAMAMSVFLNPLPDEKK